MKIGMVDCDRKTQSKAFPNLALMKLSAYHKSQGDTVDWAEAGRSYDRLYVSKVFSFTPDPPLFGISAQEIVYGGSGFAIELVDGKEVYHKELDPDLQNEVEHSYPDYSLYGIKDTAYGFLEKGCPRACDFCHVKSMQGTKAHRVARLSEFWSGEKNIVLLDPNITACHDWREMFQELIDSKAWVDFSQGLDIRTMNPERIEMLRQVRVRNVHFAWDRYEDKDIITRKLREFKELTGWGKQKVTVFILANFNTTLEQDIERVEFVRNEVGFTPYLMLYDKTHIKRGDPHNALARWCNWKQFLFTIPTFADYKEALKNKLV